MNVRVNIGDVIEIKDLWNLEYMVGAMDQVIKSAQQAYHWVPLDEFIFLLWIMLVDMVQRKQLKGTQRC